MTLSMRRPSKNASMNGATLSYEPLASTHVMLTNALGSAPSRSYVPLYEGMVVLARTAASLEPAWQGAKCGHLRWQAQRGLSSTVVGNVPAKAMRTPSAPYAMVPTKR